MEALRASCRKGIPMTALVDCAVTEANSVLFQLAVDNECERIGCMGSEHPLCASVQGAALHALRAEKQLTLFQLDAERNN